MGKVTWVVKQDCSEDIYEVAERIRELGVMSYYELAKRELPLFVGLSKYGRTTFKELATVLGWKLEGKHGQRIGFANVVDEWTVDQCVQVLKPRLRGEEVFTDCSKNIQIFIHRLRTLNPEKALSVVRALGFEGNPELSIGTPKELLQQIKKMEATSFTQLGPRICNFLKQSKNSEHYLVVAEYFIKLAEAGKSPLRQYDLNKTKHG